MKLLLETLKSSLQGKDIVNIQNQEELHREIDYTGLFLTSKRIEGCSEKTLAYYESTILKMHRAFFKTQVYNEKLHEYAECGSLRSRY